MCIKIAGRTKLLPCLSPQVPQHNQAVLSQGGRRGADVRRHRGGELQGREAVAHQRPGPTHRRDLWFAQCVESGVNNLALRHWPRDSFVSLAVVPMRDLPVVFQEAAGEGVPILLVGNKMDMDEDRQVSFKDAEQLAHVSSAIILFTMSFMPPLPSSLRRWYSFDTVCRKATSCSPRSAPTLAGMWPSPWLVWPGRAVNRRASNQMEVWRIKGLTGSCGVPVPVCLCSEC